MRKTSALRVMLLGAILIGVAACSSTSDPNIQSAEDALDSGNYAQAIASVDAAIQADPSNAEHHLFKARILGEQAADTDNAQQRVSIIEDMTAAYDQAAQLNPAFQGVRESELFVAFNREKQRGGQAFAQASQDPSAPGANALYVQAAGHFGSAAVLQPDSTNMYLLQASALQGAGRTSEIIAPLQAVIASGDNVDANVYIVLARALAENNRTDEAISNLRRARQAFPQNEVVRAELVNIYVQANMVDEAIIEFRALAAANPNEPLYQYNLGALLLQTEQYDEAIGFLTRAAELQPDNGSALYNLGAAYTNAAIDINERWVELQDELRAQRSNLSQADIQARQQAIDQLAAQRRQMFERAIQPLERARTLLQAQNQSIEGVCAALYQSYVQTGQTQQAEAVEQCAGF